MEKDTVIVLNERLEVLQTSILVPHITVSKRNEGFKHERVKL